MKVPKYPLSVRTTDLEERVIELEIHVKRLEKRLKRVVFWGDPAVSTSPNVPVEVWSGPAIVRHSGGDPLPVTYGAKEVQR